MYPHLSNPEAVQGRLEGEKVTLWVDSEFTRQLVGRPNVLEQVAKAASALLGRTVHCTAVVGTAPPPGALEVPAAPAAERDRLDDLIEAGRRFDNVTIQ